MTLSDEAGPKDATGDAGLTLIEMLVVLAVIGIASGATILSLPGRGPGAEVEARRLAGAMQAAADSAILGGAPAAVLADANGYSVSGIRRALPDGMRLEGAPSTPVALALSDTSAIDLTLVRGNEAWAVRFDGLRATASRVAATR